MYTFIIIKMHKNDLCIVLFTIYRIYCLQIDFWYEYCIR